MYGMTIGGASVTSAETYEVINPATGEIVGLAPECTPEQLESAMSAASAAYTTWRRDDDSRRKAMLAVADILERRADEIVDLLVAETGKLRRDAQAEVGVTPLWFRYYAGLDWPGRTVQDDAVARIDVTRRPMGVVAAITPWNGPVGMWSWKVAPAIRAGNSIVLKPSPFTPLATLLVGQIVSEALPPGVMNIVSGGDSLGAAMTSHPAVRAISFTGSSRAGLHVAQSAAADLKRVTLELGGNDAAIVLDDAELDFTAASLYGLATYHCGQICTIPKRIFLPRGRFDEFAEAIGAHARSTVVGSPLDETTMMGPLTTEPQLQRVSGLVEDAVSRGARVVAGGNRIPGPGYFFQPTVLANVAEGVPVVDEEQFGPVIPLLPYDSVDEALGRANNSSYGLGGSVWSADEERACEVASELVAGTVWVNGHASLSHDVPFSGARLSGIGSTHSPDALLSFTEQQVVNRRRR